MAFRENVFSARFVEESCNIYGCVISTARAVFVICEKSSSRSRTLRKMFHSMHICVE